MAFMQNKRIRQILRYGWKDAGEISGYEGVNKTRINIFLDILHCFKLYYIFSNQYKTNKVWSLSEQERKELANKLGKDNKNRDEWIDDYYDNRQFLHKYSDLKYETSPELILERQEAYRKRYNMGENCSIQNNVIISREHFLSGTISIGNNVLLAKNVFIDYSGFLEIRDNVALSDGVIIETHSHVAGGMALKGQGKLEQTHLLIETGVSISSKAIILETCNKIGRHTRVGAGTVVRKNIPPYAIVLGNPAKIVGFLMTPEEVELFEKDLPENEKTSIEEYHRMYDKMFIKRNKEIREFVRL